MNLGKTLREAMNLKIKYSKVDKVSYDYPGK